MMETMCYYPIKVKSVKGVVPCGKCLECLQANRAQWTYRLYYHEKASMNAVFLTLTYADYAVPKSEDGKLVLCKSDLRDYIKKVRKENPYPDMKYYAVGEYGPKTNRPHYHAIMFNVDKELLAQKWSVYDKVNERYLKYGSVTIDPVTRGSIHYVTKYVVNKVNYGYIKKYRPFTMISNGIGLDHINKTSEYYRNNPVYNITYDGGEVGKMPRYMVEKIYDDEMKEIVKEETKQYFEAKLLEFNYADEMNRRAYVKQMYKRSKSKI